MQQVEIYLFGGFEIRFGDRVLKTDDWPRKKAASLLKRLAFERRLLKDQVMEFLWPEADPSAAANNLYKTIHVIRRTLNAKLGSDSVDTIFRYQDSILSLQESVWVDTVEFEHLVAVGEGAQQQANLEKALDLYQGEFLPDDLYEDWTQQPREAFFGKQRDVRLALSAIQRDEQNFGDAIALLRPLLVSDPVDEPTHRELIRLYALSGQQHEALRQYQTCVDALASEMDASPGEETTVLREQVINHTLQPAHIQTTPPPHKTEKFPTSSRLPAEDRPRPLFVARQRELDILQAHLSAALAGEGRVFFITGEAGQGKTNLMAEFAYQAQLRNPDLVVAAGACHALAGITDPYLPFRDIVAMLCGDWQRPWVSGDISIAAAKRLQAIAPQTVQILAELASDLIGVVAPVNLLSQKQSRRQNGLSQHQIFNQMGDLLRELSRHQPLLLLLDDVQWIDTASAGLFFYLARQLMNSTIMVVAAFRPSEANQSGSTHPLAPVVQELVRNRGDILIDLDALQPEEERGFVEALLNSEPNRLDASFREAMFRRTKGHPLFTVELLRALQDQGDLVQDEAGMWTANAEIGWDILPARVEAVIARRIDRLPDDLRRLLEVASVEGEGFTVEVLAQVHDVSILPLLNDLSKELDHRYRLVREQGEVHIGNHTLTRYHFRHHLFQEYLYQNLSQAQRKLLHAQVASVLEQFCGSDCQPVVLPLAYHFLAAGNMARAVPYLIQAGDDAQQRVALEDAARFYQTALDHWHGDDLVQAEVLQKMGETLLTTGKADKAVDCFITANELYQHAGDRASRGAVLRLTGRSFWELGDRANALSSYHQALEILLQEPEGEELARAYSGISQMHMLADAYEAALDWGQRAITLAEKLGSRDVITHVQVHVGISKVVIGDAETGLAMLTESLEQAQKMGLLHDAGRAYTGLGDSLVQLERYEEAREVYKQMLNYARKVQAAMFEGVALVQLGYLDWWAGRWQSALERLNEIHAWMMDESGSVISKIWASTLIAQVWNDLGMPDHARAALIEYTSAARSAGEPQTTIPHLLQLARATTSTEEHDSLVQELKELLDAAVFPRYETLPALAMVCTWLVERSDGDAHALQPLAESHARLANRQLGALLAEAKGYAAGMRGEWQQSALEYQAAAEKWDQLNRPFDQLRAWAGLITTWEHLEKAEAVNCIRRRAIDQIEKLAAELPEPEMKEAFRASPLVLKVLESSEMFDEFPKKPFKGQKSE